MTESRKRLVELVLRSTNVQASVEFYCDVICLKPYASLGNATFLTIDDESEGHPQFLAIFDQSHEFGGPKDMQPDQATSGVGTLHHFAFMLELKDYQPELERLQSLDVDLHVEEFPTFGWRSIFMHDPDGNSVELVSFDPSIFDAAANQNARQVGE